MKRLRFIIPFLVLTFISIFNPACAITEPEVVEEQVIDEPTVFEELEEESMLGEIEKENINKFLEKIREYSILEKAVDYSYMAYEAAKDRVDGKISKEGVGLRYLEIVRKVNSDYFLFDIISSKSSMEKDGITITDDIERVIELISNWSNKTKRYYEYMSSYYYGDGPEYEIEANKIDDELQEITDEYIELTNEMAKKAKTD